MNIRYLLKLILGVGFYCFVTCLHCGEMVFCKQDGDLLAVITDKSANLLIWDANNSKSQWLDTGLFLVLNLNFLVFRIK
jgi:hypothetical protein